MATIIEPKTEEPKPQPVTPTYNEPELFAAEIAMEGKSLNLFPLLLIAGLIFVVGGTIFYFVKVRATFCPSPLRPPPSIRS